jgi:hypothetical protein
MSRARCNTADVSTLIPNAAIRSSVGHDGWGDEVKNDHAKHDGFL